LRVRLADESEDPIRLDGAIFPEMYFEDIVFPRSVSFFEAQFVGKKTSFSGVRFEGPLTYFHGAHFQCLTEFRETDFLGERVSFEDAIFSGKEAFFLSCLFRGEEVTFLAAEFHGETLFIGVKFESKHVVFSSVKWKGWSTYFSAVEFHADVVYFWGTVFSGRETSFSVEFHTQWVNFSQAEFRSVRTLIGLRHLEGSLLFRSNRPRGVFVAGEVEIATAFLVMQGQIVFDSVDLSRTRFLSSSNSDKDVSFMRFLDVYWNHGEGGSRVGRTWRSRAYDETVWRELRRDPSKRAQADVEYLAHLGRMYRSLKSYYRERGEHPMIGHFHYGLMEVQWFSKEAAQDTYIRRSMSKWLSWEALYRYSSGYGEDYVRAAGILGTLLLAFGVMYWTLGEPVVVASQSTVARVLPGLLLSIQTATLDKVAFYDIPKQFGAQIVRLLELISVPIQFGFFLFALRNRFRR
jgi:hypothetical protein